MKVYYITFRSVTTAQRGEQILNRAGTRAVVLRTPKWMESQGCGYSLRIRTDRLLPVIGLLRDKAVPFRRVYVQNPEGSLEGVEL